MGFTGPFQAESSGPRSPEEAVPSVGSSSPSRFPQFAQLPVEIQSAILEEAAREDGNLAAIQFRWNSDKRKVEIDTRYFGVTAESLMRVSYKAREIAKKERSKIRYEYVLLDGFHWARVQHHAAWYGKRDIAAFPVVDEIYRAEHVLIQPADVSYMLTYLLATNKRRDWKLFYGQLADRIGDLKYYVLADPVSQVHEDAGRPGRARRAQQFKVKPVEPEYWKTVPQRLFESTQSLTLHLHQWATHISGYERLAADGIDDLPTLKSIHPDQFEVVYWDEFPAITTQA
ncbi:hypothetical protein F4780DRAFT_764302 [Xylariomycetidae sp. FL0641]|nr:hypothetical protein F4780DRAFT_764302 [Xylariomycetidae sp. FL0641]